MLLDLLSEVLNTLAPGFLDDINTSRDLGNGRKISRKTSCLDVKGVWIISLMLACACVEPNSISQVTKQSIDVPPHSRLILRAFGSGDQVYSCVNRSWELKAPDAQLLNDDGVVIGRHFAGPTWQLNDGSWVKGKAIAQYVAPDATAVPWLLLESVDGTGKLKAVRFIQRTKTRGGRAPNGSCGPDAIRRVPYTATYSFYEAAQ